MPDVVAYERIAVDNNANQPYGWLTPKSLSAYETVSVDNMEVYIIFFPDEIMEIGEDTGFDSPFSEISIYITRIR
jgi:hypothetical protein